MAGLGRRLVVRLHVLRSDRGEVPSKAIIYAGMAIIAAALVAWAGPYVMGYLNSAPTATP